MMAQGQPPPSWHHRKAGRAHVRRDMHWWPESEVGLSVAMWWTEVPYTGSL